MANINTSEQEKGSDDSIDASENSVNVANRKKNEWERGTCLVTGDSPISGMQEKRMGKYIKVRGFSGACISDFYSYSLPLLATKISNIILMVGTNDAITKSSDEILGELNLRRYTWREFNVFVSNDS